MTTVYFIRHAQSDNSVYDNMTRPLTLKGMKDRELVTNFLNDKQINVVLSSPLRRSIDTVSDFAEKNGFLVETINDFREHKTIIDSYDDHDYFPIIRCYWSDMSYKIENDESLEDVQNRNISALNRTIARYRDKNIVIGTHGIALSTIINFYDSTFGYNDFISIVKIKPWVVKMKFDNYNCVEIEKINLISAQP